METIAPCMDCTCSIFDVDSVLLHIVRRQTKNGNEGGLFWIVILKSRVISIQLYSKLH